jgi:DNA-directed RNA polymerase specialized sigma24 family protein
MWKVGMLMESPATREQLTRIVGKLTANVALQQDLMQEALIHLWLLEEQRPGQTTSWYLQSCRFHLQHYLAAGRSVDSTKRSAGRVHLTEERNGDEESPWVTPTDCGVLDQVNAREILSLLSPQLKPREQAVLACLADGLGAREIARRLKVSHPMAIKYRRKIAALAARLGISVVHARSNGKSTNGREKRNGNSAHNAPTPASMRRRTSGRVHV